MVDLDALSKELRAEGYEITPVSLKSGKRSICASRPGTHRVMAEVWSIGTANLQLAPDDYPAFTIIHRHITGAL